MCTFWLPQIKLDSINSTHKDWILCFYILLQIIYIDTYDIKQNLDHEVTRFLKQRCGYRNLIQIQISKRKILQNNILKCKKTFLLMLIDEWIRKTNFESDEYVT